MKRVYCLYRVSTKKQTGLDDNDIPMQEKACRDFAARQHDWKIIKEYKEKGVSGYKVSAEDRDIIQELLKAAKNHEFDVLLVFKFDRIGRIEDETPFLVQTFVKLGIEVWSTVEGQRKFDNHVDTLTNFIYYWQAQGESENTSIRIKTRMHQLTAEGAYTGGVTPFGYRRVKNGSKNRKGHDIYQLAVDDVEADVVRLIFDKTVKEGYGSHRMAELLNNRGIKTRNGSKFQCNTVNRILKNRMYCGYFTTGETVSPHLPELQIIDEETFKAVQYILEQRSYKNEEKQHIAQTTKGKTLLSGNIYCAHCGSHLVSSSYYDRYTLADETKMRVKKERYICYNRSRKLNDCDGQYAYVASRIDEIVIEMLREYLRRIKDTPQDKALEIRYEKQIKEHKSKLKQLLAEKEKKEKQLNELSVEVAKSLTGESKFSYEILTRSAENITTELKKVRRQIIECESVLNEKKALITQ